MKFSENWLRTFVDPPLSAHDLAHVLTMAGTRSGIHRARRPTFNKVVVAEVLSVRKHPNADLLHVCEVNAGAAAGAHSKLSVARRIFARG